MTDTAVLKEACRVLRQVVSQTLRVVRGLELARLTIFARRVRLIAARIEGVIDLVEEAQRT